MSHLTEKDIHELYDHVFYRGIQVYREAGILGESGAVVQFARAVELRVMKKLVKDIAGYMSDSNCVYMTSHLTTEDIHELYTQVQRNEMARDDSVQLARAVELLVVKKLIQTIGK